MKYGNKLEVLTGIGKDTLQKRITDAMGNNTHCVQMDIVQTGEGSIYQDINRLLNCDDSQFIEL